MCSSPPAAWRGRPRFWFAQSVLGEDRVMYAMDYPYQYEPNEVRTHDLLEISLATKRKLMQQNAERWFKL
jgi:5-carboxyvanillate decarboxylase